MRLIDCWIIYMILEIDLLIKIIVDSVVMQTP